MGKRRRLRPLRTDRSLLEQLSGDTRRLSRAWKALNKRNKRSAGLSRLTLEDFDRQRPALLKELAEQLRAQTFQFSAVKGVAIPKGYGKAGYRPIRVQEIRDRLVSKALADLIEPSLQKKHNLLHPSSFGYQREVGVRDALHEVISAYREHRPWFLEADIVSFFDKIDRRKLLDEMVFPCLPESSLNSLLMAA